MRRIAQFDLNLLETFEAIYSEGGVSRAARHLNLSQPAVSHALAKLREAFGDELFVREGNLLVPTHMAREIIGPVREALRNFGFALNSAMAFDPSTSNRLFRIGMRLSGEAPRFAALVSRVRAVAPNIRLASAHFRRSELVELLARGDLDLALDVPHPNRTGLNRLKLRNDEYIVAARQGHPDINGALDLNTYLKLDHVFASPRSTGLGQEDDALRRIGKSRRIAVRCQNAMSAWQIVSGSDMLLTLTRGYAEAFQQQADNQLLPLPFDIGPAELCLHWHEASHGDPGLSWLRDMILANLAHD